MSEEDTNAPPLPPGMPPAPPGMPPAPPGMPPAGMQQPGMMQPDMGGKQAMDQPEIGLP